MPLVKICHHVDFWPADLRLRPNYGVALMMTRWAPAAHSAEPHHMSHECHCHMHMCKRILAGMKNTHPFRTTPIHLVAHPSPRPPTCNVDKLRSAVCSTCYRSGHHSATLHMEGEGGDGAGLLGCVTHQSRWVFFMPTPDPYVVLKSEFKSMRASCPHRVEGLSGSVEGVE